MRPNQRDMAARITECHVVVGKAGGLTVTATLTAGRAMVVASAVPGNEKINEAFVVHGGAGVAADADDVGAVIERLRGEDGRGATLIAMGRRARELVPMHAADAVVDVALSLASRGARRTAA